MNDEAPAADPEHAHNNRLADESSPYLLQHRHNPVDWYPWGEEAFAKAEKEGKPVFLSIGYSTCHWCHVMERESFESEEIAAVMNEHFISIKVDREERPDVDAVYMAAVQAMGGRGGWPLSVWMTADGKPFFGGTYFPPEDRYGRAGFKTVLLRIDELWRTDRLGLLERADQLLAHVRAQNAAQGGEELGSDTLALAVRQYQAGFDQDTGGFGPAPKFPRAFSHWFLLRQAEERRTQIEPMVRRTLDAMRLGGIHDHVGGGFHRYSTDAEWLVPHFEKMLYDQAFIARAYVEAYQLTHDERYATTARDTLDYVMRDLRDPAGAFHSAEDADSEGEEGKFYVWTRQELIDALGPQDGKLVADVYEVTDAGNFIDEASRTRNGTNILHLTTELRDHAATRRVEVAVLEAQLAELRGKLLAARAKRIRPGLDDKVLTDWNGLIIGALAYCGRALDEPRYVAAAGEAAEFVVGEMWDGERLLHRYRRGEKGIDGFLEDYGYLAHGLFELHQATQDPKWLRVARDLLHVMIDRFHDAEGGGGFHLAARGGTELVARTKELYDGALPSGNSVALHELLRVGRLLGDERLLTIGRETLAAWSGTISRHPMGYAFALLGLDLEIGTAREIVIAGDPADASTQSMLAAVRRRYAPRDLLLVNPPGAAGDDLRKLAPYLAAQGTVDGQAAAYVCTDRACQAPVGTAAKLIEALQRAE